MKIALVTAYPPSKGSLNEYGFHFANALLSSSEVSQLSIIADKVDDASSDPDYVHRVWQFNKAGNSLAIDRALDALQPDAVIFNLQFASFGNARVPAALGLLAPYLSRRKRPTITLLHNIFETVDLDSAGFGGHAVMNAITRAGGWLFTKLLLKSDLVGLTMPRYIDIIQKKYSATNLFHSPHGSFNQPRPIQPLPVHPAIMTFGKFGTYKKVELLLESHERLLKRNPNVRLVIGGSDSPNVQGYLASVQAKYAHLPNVVYTGYVAEEEVPGLFANSTIVVFPYESTTGSSGVLHQAGEFGRAAVMPKIGDLADLVQDEGYQARFFTPGNVESLTEALWDLISNRDEVLALGASNHRAASGITLDMVAALYIDKLKEIQEKKWKLQNRLINKGAPTI